MNPERAASSPQEQATAPVPGAGRAAGEEERLRAATLSVAEAAARVERLDELFPAVHGIVSELMPARSLFVALVDPATGLLQFPYFVDERDPPPAAPQSPAGTLPGLVLRTRAPLLLTAEEIARLVARGEARVPGSPPVEWLGVPLMRGLEAFGVLAVQSHDPAQRYSEGDREALAFVSREVATALERRQAAAALLESARRFRVLFEGNPLAMWVYDPETLRFLEVNEAALRQYGWSREEFLDLTIEDIRPAEDVPLLREYLARGGHRGQAEPALWRHRRKDGSLLSVEISAQDIPYGGRRARAVVSRDVTERIQMQDRLRRREEAFQALLEHSVDMIGVVASDGTLLYQSSAVERELGWRVEELIGRGLATIVHPDEHVRLEQALARAAGAPGATAPETFRVRRKDGSWVWVEATANNRLDDPLVRGIVVVSRNVSARAEMELALRRSERKFREIVETAAEGIWAVDAEGRTTLVNPRMGEILGYRPDEMQERTLFEFMDEAGLSAAQASLERGRRGGSERYELRFKHRDGRDVWTSVSATPLFDEADRYAGVLGMVTDVTDRRRAEEDLRRVTETLQAVISASPLAVVGIDSEGRVSLWNPAAERILGGAAAERVGREPPAAPHEGAQGLWRCIRSGEAVDAAEVEHLRDDGTRVQLRVWVAPLSDSRGAPAGALSVAEDVSRRKLDEDALRHAQKLESLGVLAGGVAHDFNNLLGVVLGQCSLALSRLPADAPGRANVEKALPAIQRAADLTAKMLAYSGRGHFEVRPLDLSELVRSQLPLYQAAVPKTARLALALEDRLPPVVGDAGQLHQALLNLVLNAGEALGARTGTIGIATRLRTLAGEEHDRQLWVHTGQPLAPGSYVELSVVDDGPGMPPALLSRIFDPFFTTKFVGRGLGLAAVLGIVRGHGGGIAVTSEPGERTRFTLMLPARAEAQPAAAAPRPRAEGAVLVVDDEETLLEVVSDVLEGNGYRVATATDGAMALKLYAAARSGFALVLLDLSMPELGGEETFRRLLEIDPEARVVLTSGYTEDEATRGFGGRLAGFIQKPFAAGDLLAVVRRALGR